MGMDRYGRQRSEFTHNKRTILLSQNVCAICGQPVDKSLKFPHPMSPTIDHIIPVDRGGHRSAIDNLQLAHLKCNRAKSDKLVAEKGTAPETNRDLPLSRDWSAYRA